MRSTVNGYVTNFLLRVGDYANTGSTNISVIDSDSFWVSGYFEETKMGSFAIGDAAKVYLMGYNAAIEGHVQSITRGISTPNATSSVQGLPSVEAVYTWVRLAQRIPVRIQIDSVPPAITLSARNDGDGRDQSEAPGSARPVDRHQGPVRGPVGWVDALSLSEERARGRRVRLLRARRSCRRTRSRGSISGASVRVGRPPRRLAGGEIDQPARP